MILNLRKLLYFLGAATVLNMVYPDQLVASDDGQWAPSAALVADIEASLTMPRGASPLASYVRYYSGQIADGHPIVSGTFVLDAPHAGVRIVEPEKMPQIFDRGCAVITLKYDVEKKKVLSLFCSGVA